jgi:GNAT superfamily N-acetyltransferase
MPGGGDYSIREFGLADLETVKELVDHTIDVCYPADYCQEAVDFFKAHHSIEKIERSYKSDYIIILTVGEEIVGTGTLTGDEIVRVFVQPDHQGCGYGKVIMQILEEKARQNGIGRVRIDASLPSLDFYRAQGYMTTEVTFHPVANNMRLDYEKMEKVL